MKLSRYFCLIPCLVIVSAFGCGSRVNPQAPAYISGSVTYKGKPVTGGTVQFVTQEGVAVSGGIDADGTYAVSDVPMGELIVVVETESINPDHKASTGKDADRRTKMMGDRPPPPGQGPGPGAKGGGGTAGEQKYIKIPDQYTKAKTSPLTFTAKAGRQVHTIELQ
jgi:hypothetical protein